MGQVECTVVDLICRFEWALSDCNLLSNCEHCLWLGISDQILVSHHVHSLLKPVTVAEFEEEVPKFALFQNLLAYLV